MRRLYFKVLRGILRLEHFVYCVTDCGLELPLHRAYYRRAEQRYNEYLFEKETLV